METQMAVSDTNQAKRADRTYVKSAMKMALLEADHELALARRWRESNDQGALHELTSAYLRLVISTAGRYRHYGLPAGDLVQEGNIGLMQAAARFEPERGVRFSTYAAWWIRSSIQDYVLRNWSIVRTGTTAAQKSLFFNMRRLQARIDVKSRVSGQVSADEGRQYVAQQLNVPVKDVMVMEGRLSGADRSLNAPMSGDESGLDWQDVLADERPLPDEIAIETLDGEWRKAWISRAMAKLNPREQVIIKARLMEDQTDTLEALGGRLGISKERVRQIEHQALGKLKSALLKDAPHAQVQSLI
jgi:RNA polymerase sigma-32 factor